MQFHRLVIAAAVVLWGHMAVSAVERNVRVDTNKPNAFTTYDPLEQPELLLLKTHKITTDLDPSESEIVVTAPLVLWRNTVHTEPLHVHEAAGVPVGARFYLRAHGHFKGEGPGVSNWYSHVVDIDMDTDSDRTGAVDGTLAEDQKEETAPGALVCIGPDDPDRQCPTDIIIRRVLPLQRPVGTVILKKISGPGEIELKKGGEVILSDTKHTSRDLWPEVSGADLVLKAVGVKDKEGEVVLRVEYQSSGLEDDTKYDDTVKLYVYRAEIDAYVYSDSNRKIEDLVEMEDPAVVVASGWVRYEADVSDVPGVRFSYEWEMDKGVMDERDKKKKQCDWDAPSEETTSTITLKIKIGDNVICERKAEVSDVRPKVVKVWFKDDGGGTTADTGNEHRIFDSVEDGTPEFDADANTNEPTCYTKGTWMWVEADMDASENLTMKTPIRVIVETEFERTTRFSPNQLLEDGTLDWASEDYRELSFRCRLPDLIRAYEDFPLRWKIEAISWQKRGWVDVYTGEKDTVSQETSHKACYLVYGKPVCAASDFTYKDDLGTSATREDHIPLAVSWADGQRREHPIARKTMISLEAMIKNFGGPWAPDVWNLVVDGGGDCETWAILMREGLSVIGVGPYQIDHVNEMREPNPRPFRTPGGRPSDRVCPVDGFTYSRAAWGGGIYNNWQGVCKKHDGAVCYSVQGWHMSKYRIMNRAPEWPDNRPFDNVHAFEHYSWLRGSPAGWIHCTHLPKPRPE